MRIGIFSDLHLDTGGGRFSGIWDKNLITGLDVLDQVIDVFRTERCDQFFFLGDLFSKRYSVDGRILHAINQVLGKLRIPGIFIDGNHDLYAVVDRRNVGVLQFLELHDGWSVIEEPTCIDVFGLKIVAIPFMKEFPPEVNQLVSEGGDILIMHQLMEGFPIYKDYVPQGDGLYKTDKASKMFKWVLAGHDHLSHIKGNVVSVGSPRQLTFGDEGDIRGCWTLDWDTNTLKFHELKYPKFHTVSSLDEVINPDDRYRIVMSDKQRASTVGIPDNVSIIVERKEEVQNRLALGDIWTWNEVLKKYVDLKVTDQREREILVSIGQTFLPV